jgi:hypothetical protein
MDPLAIIIGLFILAAIVRNKELSGDDASEENKEVFTYLGVLVLILVLAGLGFLFGARHSNRTDASLLLPVFLFMVPVSIFAKGPMKPVATAACLSVLVFIIMGSFF